MTEMSVTEARAFPADEVDAARAGFLRDAAEVGSPQRGLEDTASRFSTLIASLPAAVLVEDQHRRIVLTNHAFTDLFGIPAPPEALLGADCSQAAEQSKHLFADPEGFVASVERALAGRVPVIGEEADMVDGRVLERDYVPVYRGSEYLGHLWLYRDVTETRAALHEAARSHAELAEAQRLANVGSWTWDPVADASVWSDEMRHIYGLAPGEATPSFAEQSRFYAPEAVAEVRGLTSRSMATGEAYEIEFDIVRSDGAVRHLIARGEPMRDAFGASVGFRGTAADITERKNAQTELERSRQELAEAQRVAKVGSWTMDARTGLAMSSEETIRIFGMVPSARSGVWIEPDVLWAGFAQLVDPETMEAVRALDARTRATGEPYELEYDLRRPDGEQVRVHSRTMAVRDASGAIVGLRGTIADITEQHRAAEALSASESLAHALVEQLQQADAAKNQFISALSHELRNPLAAIMLALKQLQDAAGADHRTRRAFEIVERQSQHLSRIVDDLLDVTRMTRNTILLKTEPVGLGELVRRIADDNRAYFDIRGVVLKVRAGDPVQLAADPARLMQAVGNLLHNAAKFSHAGGTVTLDVEQDLAAGEAVVTVADHGRGIAADLLPTLFQPFTQADQDADRAQGGLGLGLSIVKQIAELHGGTVTAASDGSGKGSVFTLRLPLTRQTDATPAPPSAVTAAPSPAEGGPRRLRVLLIEDDEDLRELTAFPLERLGHEVVAVGSGPEGIAAAARERPDVIVCDIGLPGMDGYAVARALRADDALRAIPLVALTGYGQPGDIERALAAGFDHHMMKPVSIAALDSVLGDLPPRHP